MIKDKKIVAVCIAKIGDDGSYRYIEALQPYFLQAGYRMMVYHTCSDFYWNTPNEEGEKAIFELIDYDITDAVVIVAGVFQDKELIRKIADTARAHGKPVVSIDGTIEGCVSVLPDYAACIEELIEHVIVQHGVRDLNFISGVKGNDFAEERLEVFKRVLAAHDIPCGEDRIFYGDFWSGPTQEAVRKMVQENRVPKALICANDSMAIAACEELQKSGYRIPEDVIVTGFDGIVEGRYSTPSLTSCDSNYTRIGEEVTELLGQLLAGEKVEPEYKIPFKVHLAQSCGCVKENAGNLGAEMLAVNDRLSYYKMLDRGFYEASAEILTCDNEAKISKVLEKCMPVSVICMIDEDFWETENTPNIGHDIKGAHQLRYVLFDSRKPVDDTVTEQYEKCGEIVPDLEELLDAQRPLVFTAICFWNRPIGYVCTYFDVTPSGYQSISQCAIGISNALGGFYNIRYQHYLNNQIEKIYAYDSLTGLLNRQGFYKYSKSMVEKMCADGQLLMLSTDLDGLKQINDCYGHLEGDNAIAAAAKAIREAYPEDKICFRFGGDEMICLIPVHNESDMEEKVRASIEQSLAEYNRTSGKPYTVSLSMGFFLEEVESFSLEKLIKKADTNMYSEKKAKKERGNT